MNLLIIGDYPVATQARMRAAFPAEWQLTIAAPDACAPHLADAEAVIPEHVLVDDAFLAQAPRPTLSQTTRRVSRALPRSIRRRLDEDAALSPFFFQAHPSLRSLQSARRGVLFLDFFCEKGLNR
ncbi:MAG: hypothetical protein UEX93_09310 [Peptococcaceae bacterium]|nr:hypothetical protein [Peptococcaceae bacterium]